MQTGTALGLLVGGAVLLLSVSPPKPIQYDANGQPIAPAPAPGGSLNPLNWFNSGGGSLSSRIFGNQAPAPARDPNFQNAGYSPYASPFGYSPYAPPAANTNYQNTGTPAGYDPNGYQGEGMGTPMAFQYPVMTPAGGFQSLQYMQPYEPGAGYGSAGYSPYDSPQTPIYRSA